MGDEYRAGTAQRVGGAVLWAGAAKTLLHSVARVSSYQRPYADLSSDVLGLIFLRLNPSELAAVSRVSRQFHDVAQQDFIYKRLFEEVMLPAIPDEDVGDALTKTRQLWEAGGWSYKDRCKSCAGMIRKTKSAAKREYVSYELHHSYALVSRPVMLGLLYSGFYALICKADGVVPFWIPRRLLTGSWLLAGTPCLLGAGVLLPWCLNALRSPSLACYRLFGLTWLSLMASTALSLARLDGLLRVSITRAWLPALTVSTVCAVRSRTRARRYLERTWDQWTVCVCVALWLVLLPRMTSANPAWWFVLSPLALPALVLAWFLGRQRNLGISIITWVPCYSSLIPSVPPACVPRIAEYAGLCMRLGGRPVALRGLFVVPLVLSFLMIAFVLLPLRERVAHYNPPGMQRLGMSRRSITIRRRLWAVFRGSTHAAVWCHCIFLIALPCAWVALRSLWRHRWRTGAAYLAVVVFHFVVGRML
ncbi:hypothetical protein PAPYR_9039 [Paratrimastix pyriformis]|uniref:F-box domain-containing protein n=1 Tax=Paratrimastix pyriformis TaxID=342808 RepID=A0ABQ8UGH2_9EUKA|nr:hypothetical protein PAPYR_9039 [Paratrimastix pyriformis]